MANIKPLTALVLAMADEMINDLQASHDQFGEDGDWNTAKQISIKIERLSMLQSMVELQSKEQEEQRHAPTPIEAITAYLQEHDPDVFPIGIHEDGKLLLITTHIGILGDTSVWLDANYPGIVAIDKVPRSSPTEQELPSYHPLDTPGVVVKDGNGSIVRTVPFNATRNPGFVPEVLPTPIRREEAIKQHNPQINPGMPIDGAPQGLPGGKVGAGVRGRT